MREFSNHAVLSMSNSTMAVSSKYTQDLSVQIVFFTFSCKWFLCFYFWAVIWSYIIDLFAGLHELASASVRTLLKLASSVCALLKPYGDTLSNPLASSSLPKREVWKCFKSSSHTCTTSQVSVRTEPRKIFAKLNHFRSAVFLQFCSSCGSKRETLITSQKILRTKVRKVGGNVAFLCNLVHYFPANAKEDKIRCLF